MLDKEGAALLIDAKPETMSAFDVLDAFNDGNRLDGWICRQSDHRYGALVICRVCDQDVTTQIVWCTPKLRYPFDRGTRHDENRRYRLPEGRRLVAVYPKLDGTNVCAYSYADAAGQRFVTFKTRLTPVIQDGKFGPFQGMWRELLDGQADLERTATGASVRSGYATVSFEMYGYRNPHPIVYGVPLEAKALFVVAQSDHAVFPADVFFEPSGLWPSVLKAVSPAIYLRHVGMARDYERRQQEAEASNKATADGEQIEGTEGFVYYAEYGDGWQMYKCKPPGIEKIHWTSDTIPECIIMPTVRNALESCDGELTAAVVRDLLLEEFSEKQVNASHNRVASIVAKVNAQVAWRNRVAAAYAACGATFDDDGKGPVMRALSRMFDRSEMKCVYAALREIGAVKE